jgi:hypothetical protein
MLVSHNYAALWLHFSFLYFLLSILSNLLKFAMSRLCMNVNSMLSLDKNFRISAVAGFLIFTLPAPHSIPAKSPLSSPQTIALV